MPFRDVIGHGGVIESLQGGIARGALPHALLFTGRPGVGKRLVARALLEARYCESPRDRDACGRCDGCRAAASLAHPDVLVVERAKGKRDIGIGAVRELQGALHLAARSQAGRSALIDGAERLTEEAQNAFLKTLEEPPRGVCIVLLSSGPGRLLPTIRSRCALHRFGPLTVEQLREFGRRHAPGLDARVPPSLSRGSPGAWVELAEEPNPEGRECVLSLLLDPRGSPFEFAARLLALAAHEVEKPPAPDDADEPDEVSDSSEIARRRLANWLVLLEWGVRDVLRVAADPDLDPSMLVHSDRHSEFARLANEIAAGGWTPALAAIERAQSDLARNVDRALLLEHLAIEIRTSVAAARF